MKPYVVYLVEQCLGVVDEAYALIWAESLEQAATKAKSWALEYNIELSEVVECVEGKDFLITSRYG